MSSAENRGHRKAAMWCTFVSTFLAVRGLVRIIERERSTTLATKDSRPAAIDILTYTEAVSEKTLSVARSAYDDLHERAYKLTTILVAGGGAVGAFALGRLGAKSPPIGWAPLAALALSWFVIAAVLVLRAATSKELSPGNGPKNLRDYFNARLAEAPNDAEAALVTTRHAELDRVQQRVQAYNDGGTARARAIDQAYWAIAVISPLVPLVAAGICLWRA